MAEFTRDVFPGKMIQKVVTNYDGELNKTTQKIFWEDVNPAFFFECWDEKTDYWGWIRQRAESLNPPHKCWSEFLGKMKQEK